MKRALRWHFTETEDDDDRGINATRGLACELVAWRYITHLTEREAIDRLCYELPVVNGSANGAANGSHSRDSQTTNDEETADPGERSPLLDGASELPLTPNEDTGTPEDVTFSSTFAGLNALEIAAVAGARKFLSQKAVQKVIDGIWTGDIIFWDTLTTRSVKQAKIYSRQKSDP